ncbi:MAG: radical SAM protein [Pseudomonadota bacterium]|jgi:putative pyruvate formate lyase activating enzyme
MSPFIPSYLEMEPAGLQERVDQLNALASPCSLCPRLCGSDRKGGEKGYCRTGYRLHISSIHPHYGEERPLSGVRGSGTIFLTHCNLGCIFCQNADISHLGIGRVVTPREMASAMLNLQKDGCHNINFVTPSHQVHGIVEAVSMAAREGLRLPLVYNTGGYDSVETLRLLEGIFDIYMPDIKFTDAAVSASLADASDYPDVVCQAVREMHRQVGDLVTDELGIARRGLLIRHLVLPGGLAGSDAAFAFLADEISTDTYLNVMSQYRPCYKAIGKPVIGEMLSQADYMDALQLAENLGLRRLDQRIK